MRQTYRLLSAIDIVVFHNYPHFANGAMVAISTTECKMIEDFSRRYMAEDAQAPKMLGRAETEALYRIGEAISDINAALVESSDSYVTAALKDALKCLDDAATQITEGY